MLHTNRDFVVLGRLHSLLGGLSFTRAVSRSWLPAFTIAELDDGLSARAWYFQATGESHRQLTEVAIWGQDNLAVTPRLFLNLGVRFEATSASARNNPDRIAWRSFSPRASVRYQVSDALSVCGGYSMYRHRLPLDYLAYGDQSAPFAWIHRWDDRNGDAVLQPSEVGPLVANLGPGRNGSLGARIDPNLQRPRTDEFFVGGEARLGSSWVVRLSGIERRMRWLVAPVDVGVTLADYTSIDVFDQGADFLNPGDDRYLTVYNRNPASFGRDRYLLTNPPGHDGHYLGIDASLERRFDGRWFVLLGGSAHRSDGLAANRGFRVNENDPGVLGELFENPNALMYARGRLFFDRGYVIKWSGGFVSTHDWHLSAVARYQDGQHFTRMVLAPNLNQGPELVQAYTRGHSRFMFTFTLDAKLEKGLRIGLRRLGAILRSSTCSTPATRSRRTRSRRGTFPGAGGGAAAARHPPRSAVRFLRVRAEVARVTGSSRTVRRAKEERRHVSDQPSPFRAIIRGGWGFNGHLPR